MEKLQSILNASLCWRWLSRFSDWCGSQWQRSVVVQGFLHPSPLWEQSSSSSIITRFVLWVRNLLSRLYAALKLDRLFEGSVFLHAALWSAVAGATMALLPTMAALGLVLVSFASMALVMIRQGERSLVYSPVNKYLLLFILSYAVAIVFSISPSDSLYPGLLTICFVLVPLVIQNALITRRQLEFATAAIILGASLVSIIAIGQYLLGVSGASAWLDSDMFSDISTRVYGTLQNPNMLAQFLVLVLPFGAALLLNAKTFASRMVWLGCCGLMVLALLLTFSRGGWVGAILAAGIFALLISPKLLLLIPFALVALFFLLPDTIIDRFTSIGNMEDSSTSYRVSIWMGSLALLSDYWFCGVGPGTATFNLIYPLYSYSAAVAEHPHNLFLQLMVDGGICVLILFLLIVFAFCRHLCATLAARPPMALRLYLIAAIAGVGGFLAQGMTDYSFYNHRVALSYWVVIGLGIAWANLAQKEGGQP